MYFFLKRFFLFYKYEKVLIFVLNIFIIFGKLIFLLVFIIFAKNVFKTIFSKRFIFLLTFKKKLLFLMKFYE